MSCLEQTHGCHQNDYKSHEILIGS